jgi:hypothetical protein
MYAYTSHMLFIELLVAAYRSNFAEVPSAIKQIEQASGRGTFERRYVFRKWTLLRAVEQGLYCV